MTFYKNIKAQVWSDKSEYMLLKETCSDEIILQLLVHQFAILH